MRFIGSEICDKISTIYFQKKAFFDLFDEHPLLFGEIPVLIGEPFTDEIGVFTDQKRQVVEKICTTIFLNAYLSQIFIAMKIHLDKDTGIISITILIALLLMLSVFQGQAQGQSRKNILMYEKVQNSFKCYTLWEDSKLLLKPDYFMLPSDTIKKKAESKEINSIKRIKKAVPSMLISKHAFEDNRVTEYCFLPGSQTSNFDRYEKNK